MDELLGLEPDDGVTVALRALTALTALTKLELAADEVEFMGAHAVARLTSLVSLTMDDCGVGAERALAAGLTALTSLSLLFNTVREEGVCALSRLERLQRLELDCVSIGPSGTALAALSALTALTHLVVSSNNLGIEGARAVAASWPGLQHLNLNCNDATDAGAKALTSLTALRHLDLSGNRVSDAAMFTALKSRTHLGLDCELGLESAHALGCVTGLQELELGGVTEEGVALLDTRASSRNLCAGGLQRIAG